MGKKGSVVENLSFTQDSEDGCRATWNVILKRMFSFFLVYAFILTIASCPFSLHGSISSVGCFTRVGSVKTITEIRC